MRYAISCSGPGGVKTISAEGGGVITIGLLPGHWHIAVEAVYQNGVIAGHGTGDAEVKAGASNTANIKMKPSGGFVAVIAANTQSLSISNAKTAEGGAYGIGEPFHPQVMATLSDGNAYDVSEWVRDSDFSFANSSAGSSIPVDIANTSPLYGETVTSPPVTVDVKSLIQRVAWADTAMGSHTLLLYADEGGITGVISANINNARITLKSSDGTAAGMRTLTLGSNGIMFYLSGSNAKLSLDRNVTLSGKTANDAPVVYVDTSGELIMKDGSAITGNTNAGSYGGGGVVVDDGIFTMNGGAIFGNEAAYGGGVYSSANAANGFTMSGSASIRNNKATGNGWGYGGGGVYFNGLGNFIMTGSASIRDNVAEGPSSTGGGVCFAAVGITGNFFMSGSASITDNEAEYGGGGVFFSSVETFEMSGSVSIGGNKAIGSGNRGGGVYVHSGEFNMYGGTITDNEAEIGGGVYVIGTFAMSGSASINNNEATAYDGGGGVYIYNGTFTMNGGTINNNEAEYYGGGVLVEGSAFNMSGGAVIRGNQATGVYGTGGGVYFRSGTFTLTQGTIYGNTAIPVTFRNTAALEGAAVYNFSGTPVQDGSYTTLVPANAFSDTTVSVP
jgi:hypothetical protein